MAYENTVDVRSHKLLQPSLSVHLMTSRQAGASSSALVEQHLPPLGALKWVDDRS